MGPIILFDKSFLQSLSVDESVFFDHFFYPVTCPIFYIETLADLEKAVRKGRTPEQEVGIIAQKTPEMHGRPCVHHDQLCISNILGHDIPLNGRIPVAGGKLVESEGKKGVVYEPSPEAEAFSRWQEGDFLSIERKFAKVWRIALNSLDLNAISSGIKAMGINSKTCKSLEEAKQIIDIYLEGTDRPLDRLKLALLTLNVPSEIHNRIIERWKSHGYPALSNYAPYTSYLLSVELFFQIGLAAQLIASERTSNRTDIAYLFYLPFCMIFVSSDKLHKRCAPLFLRDNQSFVWGQDLKADLKNLIEHYQTLPGIEKEKGIMSFAQKPPQDNKYLVTQLWDRHFRTWRNKTENTSIPHDPAEEKEIVESYKKLINESTILKDRLDNDSMDLDMMTIKRKIQRRKGSWWQVPKDLKNSKS